MADPSQNGNRNVDPTGNFGSPSIRLKIGLAEMLKGGVIMDVMNVEQARIAEEAGAISVMALERVPAMIRAEGGVARMAKSQTHQADHRRPSPSPSWPRRASATSPRRRFCRS